MPLRYRRSTITAKRLLSQSKIWFDSKEFKDSITAATKFSYNAGINANAMNSGFSSGNVESSANYYEGTTIAVTERYISYQVALDVMRQWLFVSARQVMLSKLDTIENQMIMGIEKEIILRNLSYEELTQVLEFCQTQTELFESVTEQRE